MDDQGTSAHWMEAGQVSGVHGIRGELKVRPWCDGPDFLLPFRRYALAVPGSTALRMADAESARTHQGFLLLKLAGVDSREAAQALRGTILYFDRADAPLPEGKFFLADLIGLTAVQENGQTLGTLTEVIQPPAHDVYHITGGDRDHWVPAVPAFVKSVDLRQRRIVIALIEGM